MAKVKQKKGTKKASWQDAFSWPLVRRWATASVMLLVVGLGVYAGFDWLKDPRSLPLQVVRIEGDFVHLDRQELESVVADRVRGGFFTLDVEAVRSAIRALPWVDEVAVRRVWPDTLRIWVAEQVPLARWGSKGLVNVRGESFQPDGGERPDGLPLLEGPEGSEPEMVTRYLELQRKLDPLDLRLVRLRQDARGAWRSEFDNGTLLELGSRDLDLRFDRFLRLYPRLKATGRGEPVQVDLRYTNGLVVHWKQESEDEENIGKLTTDGNGLA
jgi:cell division protein FtsQ